MGRLESSLVVRLDLQKGFLLENGHLSSSSRGTKMMATLTLLPFLIDSGN